jgi:hypothetical protein
VIRIAAALLVVAGIACAGAPAAEQLQLIVPGIRIAGKPVGGLTIDPARQRIQAAFGRPIAIVYRGRVLKVSPRALGMHANVDRAVRAAFTTRTPQRISVRTTYSSDAVEQYVESLGRRFDTHPRAAKVLGANEHGPIIRSSKIGIAVEQQSLRDAIAEELTTGARHPLVLLMDAVAPKRTESNLGPVIVINRLANTLKLYDASRLVRAFHVATGQTVYPTPAGLWQIVDKQENPWWIPPASPWAAGAKPVPPGPGNPLGTRWMGLNAPGVGIHGTPEDASIGYSESHGCVRMHIPEAEWLFQHVDVGTPVVIL